ncbi:MAG: hypothetical protein SGI97_11455 [candidate division Zixibacteria bacterium]|nr:hypothetical protein [candidate division Zixibacteria bacterium]
MKGPSVMAGKKKKGDTLTKKTYWHLYSLQSLESNKLIEVVNKILRRDCYVVK